MSASIHLELCIDSVEAAVAAEQGGADRVELCGNLYEGGTTPSAGMIARARSRVKIGLQVMIRPRGGDFCYTPDEFEVMKRDIVMAKQLGANGIVLGLLDLDGNVDVAGTRELIQIARPMNVTFHRAFDMSRDLQKALRDIIDAGADRILTSGGEPQAERALPVIAGLVQSAGNRIIIMACGAIDAGNARKIVQQTGVKEIHAGMSVLTASPVRYHNEKIAMGAVEGLEYQRSYVPEEQVRKLKEELK
jgi:copper homeostasis protein